MPSGVKSRNVDLDDLFDPDVVGDGPSAIGVRSRGAALKYAALRYGSKRANVGIANAGSDVSNLWAAKGTATYSIAGLDGKRLSATDIANTTQPTVSASATVSIDNTGTWRVSGTTSKGGVNQPAPTTGTWLTFGGAVAGYQAQIDIAPSGSPDFVAQTNASTWATLSTSRFASLQLPSMNASQLFADRDASTTVRIRIRRATTGQVLSDTTLTMAVRTVSFV